jgi:O-antigen/teichoic acid export membrane protein
MSIAKHSFNNLVGSLLPILIAIISVPPYLRLIGNERYGVLAVIWALLGYFGFFDFGLGKALTQRMAQLSDTNEIERSKLLWTALSATFLLGLVGMIILWISSHWIFSSFLQMSSLTRNEVSKTIIWLVLALPVLLFISVLQGALQARLRFFELNIVNILGSLLTQFLPLIFAIFGYVKLQDLVLVILSSRVLILILLLYLCRRYVPLIGLPIVDFSHLSPIVSYGGWMSLISLIGPVLVSMDRLIIASINGAKVVASFTIPFDLVSRAMTIPNSISNALFPRLASSSEHNSKELANRVNLFLNAIMTPIVIIGLFISYPFLSIWLGETFSLSCFGVSEVILLGVWINSIVIPHSTRLLASGAPRGVVLAYVLEVPIYFLMLWLGVTKLGIIGAALAWTLRVILDTAILLYLSRSLSYSSRIVFPSFILVICSFTTVMLTNPFSFWRYSIAIMILVLCFFQQKEVYLKLISYFRKK